MNIKTLIAGLISALLTLAACGGSEPEAPAAAEPAMAPASEPMAAAPADLRTLLASDSRSAEDQARDAGRKPADVIEFLGIESGMNVIDVIAAGGYYTEVLSLAVGTDGRVVAQNPPAILEFRDGANEKAISARLADNRLPNVTRANGDFDAVSTDGGLYDAAITALNFHDLYNGRGPDVALASLQAIHGLLKPGGVFGLIDHTGVAEADNAALHRIEPSKAIETAEAAGFVVEEQSDLLANAGDDHTQGVFAEGIRGNTDRFVLKLRKPAE
jgi:predicted methyltransferase